MLSAQCSVLSVQRDGGNSIRLSALALATDRPPYRWLSGLRNRLFHLVPLPVGQI